MTDVDSAFLVQAGDGGELTLDCLVDGCYDWISTGSGTLAELRAKASAHLAEKHATVLDGEVVTS